MIPSSQCGRYRVTSDSQPYMVSSVNISVYSQPVERHGEAGSVLLVQSEVTRQGGSLTLSLCTLHCTGHSLDTEGQTEGHTPPHRGPSDWEEPQLYPRLWEDYSKCRKFAAMNDLYYNVAPAALSNCQCKPIC